MAYQKWIHSYKWSDALADVGNLLRKENVELQDDIAFSFEKNGTVTSKFQAGL